MDIQLDLRLNLQLQELARQQEREISAIIVDAIADYVERHTQETAFREAVRQMIAAHQWLLDELEAR